MGLRQVILAAALSAAVSVPAAAATVNMSVDSLLADINGAGVLTGVVFAGGETFTVAVDDPLDTWSLGAPPRSFTADGFEETVGGAYGSFTFAGQTFRFGSLVGRIGAAPFFYIGLGGTFTATAGELALFNWDSFYPDNTGSIAVTISTVPVPAAGLLLISVIGAGGIAAAARRRAA